MESILETSSNWMSEFFSSNSLLTTFEGFSEIDSELDSVIPSHSFLQFTKNSNSTTIHVDHDKVSHIENILKGNLNLVKCDAINGDIYKASDLQATVTLYKSNCKVHVQGTESEKWLNSFLKLCVEIGQTEMKLLYGGEQCSTPRQRSFTPENIDLSLIEATSGFSWADLE